MKVQVIEIKGNKLLDTIKTSDIPDGWRPQIGEVIIIRSGQWLVKGIAHMWDTNVIKIMCENVIKHA